MTPATHHTIDLRTNTTKTPSAASFAFAGSKVAYVGNRPPLMVPKDELFFWTAPWQEGEMESAAEREAGGLHVFDSPDGLLDWLETDDESEDD